MPVQLLSALPFGSAARFGGAGPCEFVQPQWLWIGAIASVALVALAVRAARKRRAAIQLLAAASPETSLAMTRRWVRQVLAIAGVASGCIALARPVAGFRWEPVPHQGVDLMFAVDTSKSMLAADIGPNRLTRAKLAVADLVRTFDGERVGLIAFAGDAFVQAPMTADRGVFLEALDALDTDVIPRGGTDLSSAIRAAVQAMGSEPDHKKVLVMLTDGEDLAGNVVDAAREAAKQGLTIYTVGVGSTAGELIEVAAPDGSRELVRDAAGQPVRSHLDDATLRSVAQVTGGAYAPLGADGRGLETLYAAAKRTLPHSSASGDTRKVYTERYQFPLALAISCLLGELVLGDRRRRHRTLGTAGLSLALGLGLFGMPRVAAADPASPAPVADYNAGTATYRKGDFATAQKQFEAALHTGDVGMQVNSYYDLGNTRYRAGQALLAKQDRDGTIAAWKQALASYDAALALTPNDADAKYNRDFVAKKLAALEQQKQQDDQKKQDDPKKQDQQQQPKDGRQQKQAGGQGQQPKDQQGKAGQQPKDQQGGQGQQPKDQQGKAGQQPKDQHGGQGQQPKDQQGKAGQQPKDQQGNAGQRPKDPQDPQGNAGEQPKDPQANQAQPTVQQGKVGTAAAKTAADQHAEAAQAAADAAHRAAGELTHGEAVQLLDSVESELKPMPIHGRKSGKPEPTTIRDW